MVWVTNDECHEFRLIDLTGPRVPAEILRPRESWADKSAYDADQAGGTFQQKILKLTP